MALKKYKPTTQSQRQLTNIDRSELWKGSPLKRLTVGKSSKSGHNNYGRITSWNRGGGHKQSYRIIDFCRDKFEMTAMVSKDIFWLRNV
jgi:large subunit ribosomal protein L2